MKKYFCDRCGVELTAPLKIFVEEIDTNTGVYTNEYKPMFDFGKMEFCNECVHDMLSDPIILRGDSDDGSAGECLDDLEVLFGEEDDD